MNGLFDEKVEDIRVDDSGERYVFRVAICEYEDGGCTVIIPSLPGVVSEGDTYLEAKKNIADAFRTAAAEFAAKGISIPWKHGTADEEWLADMKEAGVCDIKNKWLSINV